MSAKRAIAIGAEGTLADALLHHAVVKALADGRFSAFIPAIAHVAYETAGSADGALARLRKAIGANFPRVMQAWEVLGEQGGVPAAFAGHRDAPLGAE